METAQLESFINRYMAMWHEPDAQRRHAIVRSLWSEDAENITRRFSAHGKLRGLGNDQHRLSGDLERKRVKCCADCTFDRHAHRRKQLHWNHHFRQWDHDHHRRSESQWNCRTDVELRRHHDA